MKRSILNKPTKIYREAIKVRSKKLADGSESLYFDIYQDGERKYEFLKLYLQPEINNEIKERNKLTLKAADSIKAQRILELNKKGKEKPFKEKRQYISLAEWLNKFQELQQEKGVRNIGKFESTAKVILQYNKKSKNWIHKIDKEWILGFMNWLGNEYKKSNGGKLKPGTIIFYVSQLSAAFNVAVQMGKINDNPFNKLSLSEKIRKPESTRQFLTVEELKKLSATECVNDVVKAAFLFSCYCGLRISDIRELQYENIICNDTRYALSITMKKTGKPIYIPLSCNALQWLPAREKEFHGNIFSNLPCLTTINSILKKWCKVAGIEKHITYHSSRHTFGTLMITAGADLYVTSKLMGHSDVRTTQIYAKIIDSKKIEAVRKIDHLFSK